MNSETQGGHTDIAAGHAGRALFFVPQRAVHPAPQKEKTETVGQLSPKGSSRYYLERHPPLLVKEYVVFGDVPLEYTTREGPLALQVLIHDLLEGLCL